MGKDFHEGVVLGRATKDPEMRYTPAGAAITTVSLAVSDDYFNKETESWVNRANFFRYTIFGESAERFANRVRKGSQVLVRYTPRNNNYEKDGKTVYSDSNVVSTFQVITKSEASEQSGGSAPAQKKTPPPSVESDDVPF